MARKPVNQYAVFKNVNGTADIALYYTAGGADSLLGLPQAEADYIVDLLRNETPIEYDADKKRLYTSFEPAGEGEGGTLTPMFTLENWLSTRISIRDTINWQNTDGSIVNYKNWTATQKNELAAMYKLILGNQSPGLEAAPVMSSTPGPAENASTRLSPASAWKYYMAYVAQSLVMEGDVRLNWSLLTYGVEQLTLLFDSRNLFRWTPVFNAYSIPLELGNCTPGDPYRIYTFLKDNNLIGNNRFDTVVNLVGWCRQLAHFSGGLDAANVYNQWQYYGLPPAEYIISGTKLADSPNSPLQHRTAGCWGTTGFLRIALRTLNIAVQLEQRGGQGKIHAIPHFYTGSSYYMSHGDDPYNAMSSTSPDMPNAKLLIDQTTFTNWFEPAGDDHLNNIGRNVVEQAVVYLPNYLLKRYCEDKANGKTHANGKVFDNLKNVYTVAQLEALTLWTRMDTKIAAMGGCANVPGF